MLKSRQILAFAPCQDDIEAVKVYVHFTPESGHRCWANLKKKLAWRLQAEGSPGPRSAAERHSELYLLLFERGPTRLFAVCRSMVVRETFSIWSVTSSTTASCSTPGGSGLGIALLVGIFYLHLMSQY
jgi:hypothetical protein